MIGYIIVVFIISIILSIITEQMLIRRLQLSDGILISKGRCRLKEGYGKLTSTNAPTNAPTPPHDIGEYNSEINNLYHTT